MTEAERDRLMEFLQQLKQTRFPQYDKVALDLIADGVASHPRAAYLLVHRCLVLQTQRDEAIKALAASGIQQDPEQATLWDQGATDWGVNAQGARLDAPSKADQAVAYLLRNAGAQSPAPYQSMEDKAVLFLGQNAGKVWIGIAVLAALVVYWTR